MREAKVGDDQDDAESDEGCCKQVEESEFFIKEIGFHKRDESGECGESDQSNGHRRNLDGMKETCPVGSQQSAEADEDENVAFGVKAKRTA